MPPIVIDCVADNYGLSEFYKFNRSIKFIENVDLSTPCYLGTALKNTAHKYELTTEMQQKLIEYLSKQNLPIKDNG